jgi:hypothetical protein
MFADGPGEEEVFRELPHAALVDLAVDLRDLANPDLPLLVLHREDIVDGPM